MGCRPNRASSSAHSSTFLSGWLRASPARSSARFFYMPPSLRRGHLGHAWAGELSNSSPVSSGNTSPLGATPHGPDAGSSTVRLWVHSTVHHLRALAPPPAVILPIPLHPAEGQLRCRPADPANLPLPAHCIGGSIAGPKRGPVRILVPPRASCALFLRPGHSAIKGANGLFCRISAPLPGGFEFEISGHP